MLWPPPALQLLPDPVLPSHSRPLAIAGAHATPALLTRLGRAYYLPVPPFFSLTPVPPASTLTSPSLAPPLTPPILMNTASYFLPPASPPPLVLLELPPRPLAIDPPLPPGYNPYHDLTANY